MKFLIVDDDVNKVNSLSQFVEEKYHEVAVEKSSSFQSGLKKINNNCYDIILLDMSMPLFDITPEEHGGRPSPLAGKDILHRMKKRKITIPVIIVTQYEDFDGVPLERLGEKLFEEFPNIFMGYVFYSATHENWKNDLSMLIESTVEGI